MDVFMKSLQVKLLHLHQQIMANLCPENRITNQALIMTCVLISRKRKTVSCPEGTSSGTKVLGWTMKAAMENFFSSFAKRLLHKSVSMKLS